jgi:ferrous iron transport protein B
MICSCDKCKGGKLDASEIAEAAAYNVLQFPGGLPRIALAGNPNCGKTTAFNRYTGAHQHVGNYPGVTVDRKEGLLTVDGHKVLLVDLPGTYSLTAYSPEELVAREVLAPADPHEKIMATIDIVEAGALERSMLLAVQIREMGMPLVLACNMMDEARKGGITINMEKLSEKMGVPVIPMIARTGEGLNEAMRAALSYGTQKEQPGILRISYGPDLDPALDEMEQIIAEANVLTQRYPARWVAVKAMENDEHIWKELKNADLNTAKKLSEIADRVTLHTRKTLQISPDSLITDYRYGYIRSLLHDGVVERDPTKNRMALTDALDKVFTHTLIGPLIMLAVMYIMFYVTFEVGAYPQGWVEDGFAWLGETLTNALPDNLFRSLLVDGIIGGVGGVVSFVPLIAIMFLMIAFLEDSGYIARMAYMLDRIFRFFGLHGASVMPYIVAGGIAGGCAIPGAMATRTLRSPKEKLATLLTLPMMACGAKLPVFLLLVGVFFPDHPARTMFLLTLAGWASALLFARLLRTTIIRGQATPFVMELPLYRIPTLNSVLIHCWERTWMYLKKAGTVLVVISIVLWAALTFPKLDDTKAEPYNTKIAALEEKVAAVQEGTPEHESLSEELSAAQNELAAAELRHSVAGRLGTMVEPFTLPTLGFDWRTDVALIGGIAAKEAIVSTLSTAYSLGEEDPEEATGLAERIAKEPNWNKATALSLMLFILLYSPCFVALVVIKNEGGSWKWLFFSLIVNTAIAFGVSYIAYNIGLKLWA